jgi:hypothetical protein
MTKLVYSIIPGCVEVEGPANEGRAIVANGANPGVAGGIQPNACPANGGGVEPNASPCDGGGIMPNAGGAIGQKL